MSFCTKNKFIAEKIYRTEIEQNNPFQNASDYLYLVVFPQIIFYLLFLMGYKVMFLFSKWKSTEEDKEEEDNRIYCSDSAVLACEKAFSDFVICC